MESRGVIYYNRGTKCIIRLLVSFHSLRKHWNGPVSVICAGDQPGWFIREIKNMNGNIVSIPYRDGVGSLVLKASLWRHSPYDLTMFMDADTIVLNPIDEYFEYIKEHDFVTGSFCDWKTSGGTVSKRIKSWEKVAPDLIKSAIDFGPAVNTGIDGWKKSSSLLLEWEKLTELGEKNGCTNRIIDEIACQLLLPKHKCYIADTKWGESVKFGKMEKDTVIIHYHGSKHAGNRVQNHIWKVNYNELINIRGIKEIKNEYFGDKALRGYTKSIPDNLTIVSAVNLKYSDEFKKHFPMWMKTENLMEMPYIIFAHSDCYDDIAEFLSKYKNNLTIIKWKFPIAFNMREEMLSSFVFGVAKHVTSKYWMKLDCDCTPTGDKVIIPEEAFNSVITAPKWHYTKMKGDETGNEKHWLNRLDDWADSLPDFKGTSRLFPEKIEGRRYGHRRICSFCEIEKTSWTQHLAKMCGNRLPVPSQDTTTWYAATRIKRKITEFDFRKYLSP